MAKKTLQVTIKEPCHEDWNKMTTTQCGAFCKSCQKEVIDFTNKSEAQIVDILSQVKGKVCGRFTADKLNTPLSKYEPDTEWYSWKKWAVAAGVLFGTGYVSADVFDTNPKLPDTTQGDNSFRTLGIVTNVNPTPIPDVSATRVGIDTIYKGLEVTDTIGQLSIEIDSSRNILPMQVDTPYILMGDIAFVEGDTVNVPPPPDIRNIWVGEVAPVIMGKIAAPDKTCKSKKKP